MGRGYCVILLFVCLKGLCSAGDTSSENGSAVLSQTWPEKLKHDLLENYDRTIRPAQHYNVTNVDVKFTIVHVDIDEEHSFFSVSGWIKMNWTDNRMIWNRDEYGGLQSITIPSSNLWHADLRMLSTTLEHDDTNFYFTCNVRVASNGMHECTIRLNFKTFCEMNFRKWPFDTQHCPVVFGKSVPTGNSSVRINALPGQLYDQLLKNPNWAVTKVSIEPYLNPMEDELRDFTGLQYGIVIQRKGKTFQSTIVTPAVVFILMTLVNFWLPPGASEKILLSCVNAALVSAFLLYFTMHLPLMATRTPLVVLFFSNSLYLTSFCLIMSAVVINMAKTQHRNAVHPYIKAFLTLPGVCILIGTGKNAKNFTEDEDWTGEMQNDTMTRESCSSADEVTQAQHAIQQDWIQFAVALERTCFIIYVFVYSIMAACYLN
ncbi:neuronal acetylcholine receptor subunit alpha-5-like isoform X1 [Toxorhynchites rutilus septentrionalis]|uniref:neuronal acetylcholine receptor subunit alpha-5-like isoform X1 n=1 Tax=Toxorhynchites rutilus septentrionalis TaxID=329112 RepID=UPI00247AD75F|nr:neuronal acetylcholine receptor subunit alpha-5-like isoform X1 [Toxorhynchites rutilus septentrionalis]